MDIGSNDVFQPTGDDVNPFVSKSPLMMLARADQAKLDNMPLLKQSSESKPSHCQHTTAPQKRSGVNFEAQNISDSASDLSA